jgi:hypothetical protein
MGRRVSLCVVDHDDPDNSVSITGTAEVTYAGASIMCTSSRARHQLGLRMRPAQQRAIVKITPERVN